MIKTVKEILDELFINIKFDKKLYQELQIYNLNFITKNEEQKNLFSSQLIGCYKVKFTLLDQENFFSSIFNLSTLDIENSINKITSINKNFKIATDNINLTCFYIAHRFLSNKDLKQEDRELFASEILTFFNYRTLIILSSNYFIYPISEQEAMTLFEKLSYKFLIKNLKNWNEYCKYRSEEYIKSKFNKLLVKLNNDADLPNAINDLYSRTKDTVKNIYKEFIYMKQNEDTITNRQNTMKDLEGKEILSDKLDTADSYYNYIITTLSDKNTFIKKDIINITLSIIKNADEKRLIEFLEYLIEYTYINKSNFENVSMNIHNILSYIINYLLSNKNILNKDLITTMNKITGVILYARTSDDMINNLKKDIDNLIKEVYKVIDKTTYPTRRIMDTRNAFIIYICLRSFFKKIEVN